MELQPYKRADWTPFPRYHERSFAGAWNLDEMRTMYRLVERVRELIAQLDDPDLKNGIELLAGNLFTQLAVEVHEDPERGIDMVNELMESGNDADRDLARDTLSFYHYDLLDHDSPEDPVAEADRWRRLINGASGDQREWFCESVTEMIESIHDSGRTDLQAFADALSAVVSEEAAS